ncbi:MAG TPA: hypothetical protein VHD90_06755 [Phototrophicaceae bacterium]|nr:hypothetical protein [Phototrophicaceae bacterium]
MADDSTEALLQRARKLLVAKRYDEAREILRWLDDPKAKAWLAQLDKIAPEPSYKSANPAVPGAGTPKKRPPSPIDPRLGIVLMFLTSTIGTGVILSWNWGRLGKRRWGWVTFVLTLLLPILSLAIWFGFILKFAEGSLSPITLWGLVAMIIAINPVFVFAVIYLQYGAYKRWDTDDLEALARHKYPWDVTILGSLVVIALAAVAASVYADVQLQPKTIVTPAVSVVYSADWEPGDPTNDKTCTINYVNASSTCLFVLWEKPFHVLEVALSQRGEVTDTDAQSLVQWDHDNIQSEYVIEQVHPVKTQVIDGQTAYGFDFVAELRNEPQYIEELVLVNNHAVYQFTVTTPGCGCDKSQVQELEALFAGIKFKAFHPNT